MVTHYQAMIAYELILRRPPENEAAIDMCMAFDDLSSLGRFLTDSPEFKAANPQLVVASSVHEHHIYPGYVSSDLDVFRQFTPYQGAGSPGFITNFLGCKTRCTLQTPLIPYDGTVEGLPEPVGSTQGETAEFVGTLRAVTQAGDRFRLLELGAGYGPWMAITHAAARQRNIADIHLYGVEGDAHHVDFIHTNMTDNAIPRADYTAIHGAVGPEDGVAYWAVEEEPGAVYGGRPMMSGAGEIDYLGNSRQNIVEVPVLGINPLLRREAMWDLIHIDIQGHEGDVCSAGIDEMTDRVRRVVIGTHSRVQDGIVMAVFHKAGWTLENEKPTIGLWNDAKPTVEGMALVDGVQVWHNPKV